MSRYFLYAASSREMRWLAPILILAKTAQLQLHQRATNTTSDNLVPLLT
jgi:hypothetical protein